MPPAHQDTKFHQRNLSSIPEEMNLIGKIIVDAVYTVYNFLEPGQLEKVYGICFCHELTKVL